MRNTLSWIIVSFLFIPTVFAGSQMIVKPSGHSVAETMNRLETAMKAKGIAVVARVNHAAAAQKVDLSLRPTELLIFGNPKLGTPLMQSNQKIGLDLPLRALAWEDAAGKVWLGYEAPQGLAQRHAIGDRGEVVKKMAAVLEDLSDQAVRP
jgi:uncharacterized protein (DUF302 family)